MAAILKNRYDVITSPPIVRLRRNLTGWWQSSEWYKIWQMDAKWHPDNYTQVKTETGSTIPICIGGLPFSEPESSFTSAVHWDISSKFGMQVVIHLLNQVLSLNLNPEVHFWLHDRHLEKSIWRHNPAMDPLITTKFGRQKQNHMPMTKHRSKSKSQLKFQYGGRRFSETGSSFIWTVDWDISSKFGMQVDFHHFERMQSLNLNSEVDFRLYFRHLEKSI